MKLSEFIPQVVDRIKSRSGPDVANESERRLREILASDGDAELDDFFVSLHLEQTKEFSEATKKVRQALWDAAKEIILTPTYKKLRRS